MSVSLKTEAYFDMSSFERSVSKRTQLRSMSKGLPFKRSTDTRTCFSVSIRLRKFWNQNWCAIPIRSGAQDQWSSEKGHGVMLRSVWIFSHRLPRVDTERYELGYKGTSFSGLVSSFFTHTPAFCLLPEDCTGQKYVFFPENDDDYDMALRARCSWGLILVAFGSKFCISWVVSLGKMRGKRSLRTWSASLLRECNKKFMERKRDIVCILQVSYPSS